MQTSSVDKKETKPFWRYINGIKKYNTRIAPIKSEGKLFSDSKDKAELINKQFQSVFTQGDKSAIPQCTGKRLPDISPLNIDIPGVEKLLKNLQIGKSSGQCPWHVFVANYLSTSYASTSYFMPKNTPS